MQSKRGQQFERRLHFQTRKKMATLDKMKSGTKYKFRVTDEQLGNAATSDWISTLNGKKS
jgi:1,4-alpha-glucan branching enzyme